MICTPHYLVDLARFGTELTAVDLTGAGALAAPGNAAKAALQALLTAVLAIDAAITPAWNAQAIDDRTESDATMWAAANADTFATPTRLANARADYVIDRREVHILRAAAVACAPHLTMIGSTRKNADDTLSSFAAAVAAFAGDPGELAIATAALVALTSVAGQGGLAYRATGDELARGAYWRADWPCVVLIEGR